MFLDATRTWNQLIIYVIIPDVVPLECLWKVLVTVIPVAFLVRVVSIVVIPRRLAALRASLGVVRLLEQIPELIVVVVGSDDTDSLVVDATSSSAGGNVQVVSRQPLDDLQNGLRAAAQVGRDLGADAVRPAPLLPWWQLLHL